jgi:hypothetical protein
MKKIALILIAVASMIALPVVAQPAGDILNNAGIIELKQAGFGDTVLVEKIKTSKCNFDTSLAGLKQLKTAGVSDAVITAMVSAKPQAAVAVATAATEPSTDINDPKSAHDAGIWFYDESGGKPKMSQLEPAVYAQHQTGSGWGAGFGVPINQEAILPNAHAHFSITNRLPTFYFYFEHTQSGLSDLRGPSSPNEYVLAQFDVRQKDGERRLVIGSFSAYAGGKTGADSKTIRPFDSEKIAPGIYKIIPKQNLADGEYGIFWAANSGNGGKVFDFGVRGSADTTPQPQVTGTDKVSTNKHSWNPFKKKEAAPSNEQTNQTSSAQP